MVNNMPPIPRDHDEASFSEIVPLRSTKIKLWKSPVLMFGVVSAVIGVLLFFQFIGFKEAQEAFKRAPNQTTQIALFSVYIDMIRAITAYLLLAVMIVVLIYTRSDRSVAYYAFPVLFVTLIFLTPLRHIFFFIFRSVLPGYESLLKSDNFFASFIGMFFGAGLMEELWKATPCLLGAALTIFAAQVRPRVPGRIFDFLRVRGPLDAMLMGLAGGATFIFWETTGQYVLNEVVRSARGGGDVGAAFGSGLMLLMPRVIGGLAGHMGYSGIFCYFIGLAVIRPKHAWKLILIGWLTSAVLHGLWNSVANIWIYLWYLVAGLTVLVLIACLLKARQLEASIFGRGTDTFGSIVVGMPGSGYTPPAAAAPAPMGWGAPAAAPGSGPQWGAAPAGRPGAPPPAGPPVAFPGGPPGAFPGAPPPVAFPGGPPSPGYPGGSPPAAFPGSPPPAGFPGSPPPVAFPGSPPPAYPAGPPPAAPYPAASQPAPAGVGPGAAMALAVAGTHIPLMPGARVDLGMVPALGERGRGVVGEVSVHPRNPGVIGLKNLGAATWYARLRDGTVQPVEPQRNVRLAAGTTIDFGGGIQGAVVG